MSKKLSTLATVIIVLLFIANLVLAVLLFTNNAAAVTVSQCSPDKCPPKDGTIRVQVAIPGLSETCTYTDMDNIVMGANGSPQVAVRACHYVESLPAFVAKFYKFSIGLIAILAVIMIMFGGLQWIFAAGNIGKVGDAKATITAAIAGLILALTSYVILYNINPKLVNLELPGVSSIRTIVQPMTSAWCNSFPANYQNDPKKPVVFFPVGSWGLSGGVMASDHATRCGVSYEYGYKTARDASGELVKVGADTCAGSYCETGKICFSESGFGHCENPKELCESIKNADNCGIANATIDTSTTDKSVLNKYCVKINFKGRTDQCGWDDRIFCPEKTTRVSCLDDGAKDKCWTIENGQKTAKVLDDGEKRFLCSNDQFATEEANTICCKESDDKFNLYHSGGSTISLHKPYIPDCKNDVKKCGDYESIDAQSADPCNVCR